MKKLFIAEKPSVAAEFAKALKVSGQRKNGYIESGDVIVTWCVGHLVTMSYPDAYDPALKKWSKETLPFLPETDRYPAAFKYEVIDSVKVQFNVVKGLLNRDDVDTIYVCTDSGREGEYIYRLVDRMVGVSGDKDKRRVWIDSQTEEEILRGIKEAKPLSEYDNLSSAAYLRAKEDYLMGINFSRILSVTYGYTVNEFVKSGKWLPISVGRVMTCVLGMIVRREREIRDFVKTPFYRVIGDFSVDESFSDIFRAEWKAVKDSRYYETPYLYKDNGFKDKAVATQFANEIAPPQPCSIEKIENKKEKKNPPLLFNLAELQNMCSKVFKISPDATLSIAQELYEKKLITYPRTDARVLSSAIAGQIDRNIKGLLGYNITCNYAKQIIDGGYYKKIDKTKYVNDSRITDHYAIIPTGQGLSGLSTLSELSAHVYEIIVRRFLAIFYPAAEYRKISITIKTDNHPERFFASEKILAEPGFIPVTEFSFKNKGSDNSEKRDAEDENVAQLMSEERFANFMLQLKKGMRVTLTALNIKEGETSPPKRYNSGQMILAMENAGQLIEDEDLRAQIKGSGIGTSATRAEILKKLVSIGYIALNGKTQIYTPSLIGESVYEVVNASIKSLLNPSLTASWELGLSQVAEGSISEREYMHKLNGFIERNVEYVKKNTYNQAIKQRLTILGQYYK